MLYGLAIIMLIVSLILSANVNEKFKKWSEVQNSCRMTGEQVALKILRDNGINDVQVTQSTEKGLSDHYDPKNKVVCLSSEVYNNSSIAAIAVAAHECGHAVQHNTSYIPLGFRSALFPVARFGSAAGVWISLAGCIIGTIFWPALWLIDIGIFLFACAVLFHVITLPVEYNASNRALTTLSDGGYLQQNEIEGARSVLSAAALTYVAAALAAAIQLLRLIGLRGD